MEEKKLLVIEHKDLAGRTLTVPSEVSEDGKLVLDEKGQATLSHDAAHFLCTVPGFSVVGESKKEEEEKPKKEELASSPNPPSQPTAEELEAKKLGLQFITEGDKIICVDDEFVNLQESNKTYGDTEAEALEAYKKEFIELKEEHEQSASESNENEQEQEKTDLHTDAINEGQADNLAQVNQLTEEAQNQVAADDNLNQTSETDDKTDQEQEAADEEAKIKPKYPEGDPNPSWKKEELAAWLTERNVVFKSKDNDKVLLGKAFKFLESSKTTE
ncbi:MAG: hypothetical protein RDU14_16675 [Melioribacteraceae bacterium]|nr:hypothetical protein [Melioribacteraceae bacterium]